MDSVHFTKEFVRAGTITSVTGRVGRCHNGKDGDFALGPLQSTSPKKADAPDIQIAVSALAAMRPIFGHSSHCDPIPKADGAA
jgi:hypothetical protein